MNGGCEFGIFQIGPVQKFVFTSRKTLDYWSSSYLISHLVQKAIEKVKMEKGEIIYPSIPSGTSNSTIALVPNRFVAIFLQGEGENVLKEAEKEVRKSFREIAENVRQSLWKGVNSNKSKVDWGYWCNFNSIWDRQINDFLEIYWVTYPLNGSNYAQNYREAEAIFSARKAVRHIPASEEEGIKCTLCGERETLCDARSDGRKALFEFWSTTMRKIFPGSFREKEHLCAVCTVKRLAPQIYFQRPRDIPSTSSIATAPFVEKIVEMLSQGDKDDLLKTVEDFYGKTRKLRDIVDEPLDVEPLPKIGKLLNQVPGGRKSLLENLATLDGSYFQLATYENLMLKNKDREKDLKETANLLKRIYQECYKPSGYLAVFGIDGDNMGKLISVRKSIQEHRELSEQIGLYSQRVAQKLEGEWLSKVIYFGGDEGMVFVTFVDLFDALKCCREEFTVSTASLGVAVAHYTHPLSQVLWGVSRILAKAKEWHGKNAVGFSLFKRSGERVEFVVPWNLGNIESVEFLKELCKLYLEGKVSKSWWRDLVFERGAFIDDCGDFTWNGKKILLAEIERLLWRRSDKKSFSLGERKTLMEKFKTLVDNLPIRGGLDTFYGLMELAEFAARRE